MLCQISSRLEHTEKITGDNCFDAYRTTPLHISRSNDLKGQRAHLSHSKRSNWRENTDRIFSFWTVSLATTRHEFRVQRLETSALFVAGAAAFDEVACLIRHAAIVDGGPLDLSAAAPGGVSVNVVGEDVLALASRGIGSARCDGISS